MRVLVLDVEMMGLDFALRCAAAGDEVRLYRHMPKRKERYGEGFKEITLIDDWRSSMTWAREGLIVLTGNFSLLHELDRYREFGYQIFAPTVASARLEIDRMAGMKAAQAAGLAVPEFHVFSSLEETEKFARKQDRGFVFKPAGDEENKAMTYVASDPADLVGWLQRQIKTGKQMKQCLLQEKVDVLSELGVSGWMGPEGFLRDKWQICIEHKKLMVGEHGPATGEMGCYDDQTEVLTRDGWKFWSDVTTEDEVASLQKGATVFVRPSEVMSYDYVGPMVCWENQTLDICVTPGHNMYVNKQSPARRGVDAYQFVQAHACTEVQYAVQRTARWRGVVQAFHEVPGYTHGKGFGHITVRPRNVPMLEWARFLGFYIAEGCAGRRVSLAQSHPAKAAKAQTIVDATGFRSIRRRNGIEIGNTQLARHLQPMGLSWQKRVPQYIKDSPPEVIEAFLDGYAHGDGNHQPNGFRIFYTSNRGLADDTQELLLKIGRVGIIKNRGIRTARKVAPDGHEIIARRDAYEIIERVKKTRSWLDSRDRTERMYAGKVYCATVHGHVMYVRRNGKPLWCGNSVCQYVETDKLADEMLTPLEPVLRTLGHRGDFAVGAIVDKAGKAWFLEVTARCGYPAWWVQMASHHGNPSKWMLDLLNGKDSLRVSYDVAIGVVCAQPPFPYGHDVPFSMVEGNPIAGVDEVAAQVHLASVMKAKGPVWEDMRIVEKPTYETTGPYVLVCTGLGKTVEKARQKVYRAIDSVKFSDMIYRDDIGEKVIDCLPELRRLGYALDMK